MKLKKLLTIIITIFLSFLFNGCTQKVVIQKELLCYDLQDADINEDIQIRVYKDDIELFNARNDELKSAINFYENQNKLYKLECEK